MAKSGKSKNEIAQFTRNSRTRETREPGTRRERTIVINLSNFDANQGQTYKDWEKDELLAKAVTTLQELCGFTVIQARQQKIITVYNKVDFPPNSGFKHPKHIPDFVEWASMHVQGKPCLIGYFEDHIFHLIFLDKNHEFWITEKKNT